MSARERLPISTDCIGLPGDKVISAVDISSERLCAVMRIRGAG